MPPPSAPPSPSGPGPPSSAAAPPSANAPPQKEPWASVRRSAPGTTGLGAETPSAYVAPRSTGYGDHLSDPAHGQGGAPAPRPPDAPGRRLSRRCTTRAPSRQRRLDRCRSQQRDHPAGAAARRDGVGEAVGIQLAGHAPYDVELARRAVRGLLNLPRVPDAHEGDRPAPRTRRVPGGCTSPGLSAVRVETDDAALGRIGPMVQLRDEHGVSRFPGLTPHRDSLVVRSGARVAAGVRSGHLRTACRVLLRRCGDGRRRNAPGCRTPSSPDGTQPSGNST